MIILFLSVLILKMVATELFLMLIVKVFNLLKLIRLKKDILDTVCIQKVLPHYIYWLTIYIGLRLLGPTVCVHFKSVKGVTYLLTLLLVC